MEGHTDSLKIDPKAYYKNNLTLSSFRASAAANVFIEKGYEEDHMRVLGFGSSMPLAVDRDKEDRYLPKLGKKNRRVEIRVKLSDVTIQDFQDFLDRRGSEI